MAIRILVVDDEPAIRDILSRVLRQDGYEVDTAGTRQQALARAMVEPYDAVILDLELPDGSGVSIVRALRAAGRETPILVLTALDGTQTIVTVLDAGADDYYTKPIEFSEFKARVRALVRRGHAQRMERVVVGNVVLDRLARTVMVGEAPLPVTQREFTLLEHLMLNVDRVVTREQILSKVIEVNVDPGTNVVDVNVSRLRKRLSSSGATVTIDAQRGLGFVLSVQPQ